MDFVELVDGVDVVDIDNIIMLPIQRRLFQRENPFVKYDDNSFFIRFRMSKESAIQILDLIEPQLEHIHNLNNSISPVNQLLLTLRLYATGGHLLAIGDFINADKSTISRVVKKVTTCIAELAPNFIKMPTTADEIAKRQNDFFEIARFPRVIGAIDGCHVKIQGPGGEQGEIFRNRKGFFSINIQAVASANFLFQDLVARWPGSSHDATIFHNSRLKYRFEQNQFGNGILIGDGAYMCTNYLLTPFLNPQTDGERRYNISFVRTRVKVENLFGIWKRRFPIMAYGSRLALETTLNMIVATALLHNICQLRGEPEPPVEGALRHELQELIIAGNIPLLAPQEHNNRDYKRLLAENYFSQL